MRFVPGCAANDKQDRVKKDKNSVENVLARQFANYGNTKKAKQSDDEENIVDN